jgi:hypothetical protein
MGRLHYPAFFFLLSSLFSLPTLLKPSPLPPTVVPVRRPRKIRQRATRRYITARAALRNTSGWRCTKNA